MADEEIIEKIKDQQGVLSRIQNIVTLGYGTKDDLRELDRKLRTNYYDDFKETRHRWEEIYLEALNSNQLKVTDRFKKIIQILDRVAEKINRADYGYAGLMDRKGHIREEELARIINYDKSLSEDLHNIIAGVGDLYNDVEAEIWGNLEQKLKSIKSLILDFESKWNKREGKFRPLKV